MFVRLDFKEPAWPIPWSLSRMPNVVFGGEPTGNEDLIMNEKGGKSPGSGYAVRTLDLREGRGPIYVYLKQTTFDGIPLPGFSPVKE